MVSLTLKLDSKHTRIKNLESLATQNQWLAISVSSFKTQAVHQTDGYTIILQPDSTVQQPSELENGHSASANTEEPDCDMNEHDQDAFKQNLSSGVIVSEAQSSSTGQQIPEKPRPRAGFQRFLCAEYADCIK